MGVRLHRRLGVGVLQLEAGEYSVFEEDDVAVIDGGPLGVVTLCCPACGGVAVLDEQHQVDAGGNVTPVWACPAAGCPFMDFLDLEGFGDPPDSEEHAS